MQVKQSTITTEAHTVSGNAPRPLLRSQFPRVTASRQTVIERRHSCYAPVPPVSGRNKDGKITSKLPGPQAEYDFRTNARSLAERADALLREHGATVYGQDRRAQAARDKVERQTRKRTVRTTSRSDHMSAVVAEWDRQNAARLKARQEQERIKHAEATALPSWTGLR